MVKETKYFRKQAATLHFKHQFVLGERGITKVTSTWHFRHSYKKGLARYWSMSNLSFQCNAPELSRSQIAMRCRLSRPLKDLLLMVDC
jgi:hypothetical protein